MKTYAYRMLLLLGVTLVATGCVATHAARTSGLAAGLAEEHSEEEVLPQRRGISSLVEQGAGVNAAPNGALGDLAGILYEHNLYRQ